MAMLYSFDARCCQHAPLSERRGVPFRGNLAEQD
jgi:hypothetical protein